MTVPPIAIPATRERAPIGILAFILYGFYWLLLAMPLAAIIAVMVFWVPHFREIFKDFKTELPAATELLLSVSNVLTHSFVLWLFTIPFLFGVPLLLTWITTRFRTNTQRITVTLIMMLLTMFVSFTSMMAIQAVLMLPLIKLIQSVSGGPEGGGP